MINFLFDCSVKPLLAYLKIFPALFSLLIFSSTLDQWLTLNLEHELRSATGNSPWLWVYLLLSLTSSLVIPVIGLAMCVWTLKSTMIRPTSLWDFQKKFFSQICIEQLRAWGKSLQWCFALILPGVIKFFEYSLVVFVVTLSKDYDDGNIDALEKSTKLVRKNVITLSLIVLVFNTLLPISLSLFSDGSKSMVSTPLSALAWIFIDTLVFFVSTFLLFKVYIKSEGDPNYESYV